MSNNELRDVPKKAWTKPVVQKVSDVRRTKGGAFNNAGETANYFLS
jgi:hypothetical protein